MIREGRPLPSDVKEKIPALVKTVSNDPDILALYAFGSLAKGALKPLSDLDFAILLSDRLDYKQRFEKHLDLIGLFNSHFHTDDIDLVLLNEAPPRFSFHITGTGTVLVCSDRSALVDFIEKTRKLYLDFRYFREVFDKEFLRGIGYNG
jgi:predicted nucleotidyltransferase